MRVLQINSVCGIGSTGRIATDIDKILKNQGYESYIAYGRGMARDCDTSIKVGNNIDNYVHVAKTRIFDIHGLGSKKATSDFIGKVEELNPDIIHLHNIHGYYLNIEVLFQYLKSANKPVIWTLHDCWAFTGHCTHFDYVGCTRWKTGCFKCPQKSSYPSSIAIDNSKKNFLMKQKFFTGVKNLTVVTPSNWLAGFVKQSILGEYPIEVINNGIDLGTFKPTEGSFRELYKLNNKFIILGVASNWEERKGLDYFIQLSKKIKSDDMIVLVGLNDKQLNKLPPNIIGIKRTNSVKELAEIYSSADVFVNPTLEDNFPTTNLEALACGVPVITFNTGGSPECIFENCGYIVEKENLNNLLEKIETIKAKGKSSYSKFCINTANERYDKNSRFSEYIKLYENKRK